MNLKYRQGTRIYGTKWVDALKTGNEGTIEKSSIAAQNYRDARAATIATKSPKVSRLGLRVAAALYASLPSHKCYLRDISQAYSQAETKLDRPVYLRPVPEMNVPNGKVLKVLNPLYGIPESRLHWYVTYANHHKDVLGMTATKFDPCILFGREGKHLIGVTALQVDDTFGFGTDQFLEK